MATTNDNQQPIKNIDELVDSEGGVISGDRNVSNDSEIETGPVQKPFNDTSDYEKGISTTTDRATRYRQNIPWFAVYSYRGSSSRGLPVSETKNILTKKELDDEIKEDLVKKNKSDMDIFDKAYNNKVDKTVDMINDTDLTTDQLNRLKQAILDKINSKNG